ncbi:MAG: S8 family serine peptidase [Dehalococcoidales bacterium]|jgi:hypothetical protein|nr:S8 family serine peptidase [Dehalococcoidales bacterium]
MENRLKSKIFFIAPFLLLLFMLILMAFSFPVEISGAQKEPADKLKDLIQPEKGNPKLDSYLNQLVSGPAIQTSREFFPGSRAPAERVRVVIDCLSAVDAGILQRLEPFGDVETYYGNLIQMSVPVASLNSLAQIPEIRIVRRPYEPLVETIVSEGVQLTSSDVWHAAGYTGAGVKIAIIDLGFAGYEIARNAGELPAGDKLITHWSPTLNGPGSEVHGTACAEIIHDMAPEATLYLVNFRSEVELGNAVDWLIAQGVNIISHSVGWMLGGPGDGTGLICEIVKRATDNGILWVNSAGNHAQRHWTGTFTDADGDGFNEFNRDDETNTFSATQGSLISVFLKWNDPWNSSASDYDLYLTDMEYNILAFSENVQDGDDQPTEGLSFVAPYTGLYHIAIAAYGSPATRTFHLYSAYQNLEYRSATGSLAVPADSPDALAAGAVPFYSYSNLEDFSSQGPTDDGRIKPDLVAPDGVSTLSYNPGSFYGTSASAPCVAGAAALVKQFFSSFTTTQIKAFLESRSIDLGISGKDNLFGNGMLTMQPNTFFDSISEDEGHYYNVAPGLSHLGIRDDTGLNSGWYRIDEGDWISLFENFTGTVWQATNWQVPGFESLVEGSHTLYFKASNDLGVIAGDKGEWRWQFYKDTIAPSVPANLRSTDHSAGSWSNNRNLEITWSDSADLGSGLDGYSFVLDSNPDTLPEKTKNCEENIQKFTASSPPDGTYYFHIRAVDQAGNWQNEAVHLGPFLIDATAPPAPLNVAPRGHTPETPSEDNTIEVNWEGPSDNLSGLAGFAVVWDAEPLTLPDNVNAGIEVLSSISDPLEDGDHHYFHIRAIDNANNWSAAVHLGPFFIAANVPVLSGGSVTPSTGNIGAEFKFSVTYTDFKENAPAKLEVMLDGGRSFTLSPVDGQDGIFSNGEIYEKMISGQNIGAGDHSFAFMAIDNANYRAIGDTGVHTGLIIMEPPPPSLSPSPVPSPPFVPPAGGGGGGGSSNRIYLNEYMNPPGTFERDVSLKAYDGICTLIIPKGTVGKTPEGWALSYIILKPLQPEDEKPPSPQVGGLASRVYRLEPDGVTFSPAVTIYLLYKENEIPSGFGEGDLRIGYWEKGQGKWVVLEGCKVDMEKNAVTAPLSHFSYYALLAVPPPPPEPPLFQVSKLVILPKELEEGQSAEVGVVAGNEGGSEGEYLLQLKLNEEVRDSRVVRLAVGEKREVKFNLSNLAAGEYEVEINGLFSRFVVRPKLQVPASPEPSVQTIPSRTPETTTTTEVLEPVEQVSTPAEPEEPRSLPILVIIIITGIAVIGIVAGTKFWQRKHRIREK